MKPFEISLSADEVDRVLASLSSYIRLLSTATGLKSKWTRQQIMRTYTKIRKQRNEQWNEVMRSVDA